MREISTRNMRMDFIPSIEPILRSYDVTRIKNIVLNLRFPLLEYYLEQAKISLANTPNLLPVLKEAGVVDSGGTGFVKIVEGMLLALKGKIITTEDAKTKEEKPTFAYCVEFILELYVT